MEKKQKKRRRKRTPMTVVRTRRSIFLGGVLILCIFGLIFRMWYLQDNYAEEYDQWSAAQRARRDIDRTSATFAPVRGGFVDRHMQPITGTQQVYTVVLDVESLHDRHRRNTGNTDIREEVFNAIMMELGVPRYRLTEMFHTDDYGNLAMTAGRRRQVLATDVPREIAVPLTDMFADLHREETSLRRYNDPYFAPQVIGFSRGDAMWGLERQYDRQLSGVVGRNTWVQGETETIPVQDGYTIITTLDGEIQRLAQYYCDNTYIQHPSQQVGMIVMDPFTGEILAMAQAPTFSLDEPYNPEYFTSPELAEMWNLLTPEQQTDEVMLLWRNYHTTRSSEPGSIFKPFVVAAAIEEGIINQGNNYTCEGVRRISDMEVRCHNQNGCGYLSLSTAIYRSCNLA
ncbi:MAG: hypothetical protein LBI27_01625, partial [Clostridiales bacterium]|nr:hypothetical protein [Clostridiales bacterium]